MRIGVGIDTGGTYTDAVVFDFDAKEILGTAKALTTKEDLSVGILEALDGLPAEALKVAEVISLSTTLATNACVEDKGGSAKLIFFGGDGWIVDEYGKVYGLPASKDMYIQESYTRITGEKERDVDWELFNEHVDRDFEGLEGVGIIEINAMRNSAVVEKKARELFRQRHPGVPVVCGYELFSELNSLQRAAGTLLNARLFPVIQEFLDAIKAAMSQRNIEATVVIVRSDGSLMSGEYAQSRPIDTLLCGPAASVIGSTYLAHERDSIVVDMGGTTTDIALISGGVPVKVANGVRIGKWRTFVSGLYIKTFGLGGDTAIHYQDNQLFLEDYRVVPLSVAAARYPQVIDNLKSLLRDVNKHTKYLHEHYILIKDITDNPHYTPEEKAFCAALKDGPLILREAVSHIPGKDLYTYDVTRLLKEGVVQMCGLTPTDIMHLKGDFTRFSMEAAHLGALYVASNLGLSVDELCDEVYDLVKRRLYVNLVEVMLENKDDFYLRNGTSEEVERFINESYDMAKAGNRNPLISLQFISQYSLTGVGAPISFFLKDVAQMLGTRAVIPQHHEVANALGAIVSNVYVTNTVEILPDWTPEGIGGYTVYGNTETKTIGTLREAEAFAVKDAKEGAYDEALRRGAKGKILVTCKLEKSEVMARESAVHLRSLAVAHAVGSVGL